MRLRLVFTGAAVAVLTVFGAAGAAHAQEEGEELTHEAEECIEILEGGGSVDDCQEAPSLILPATNELIWGAISFAAVVFLLYRFAWPGIKKGLDARSERIRDDLEEAERARVEAEGLLEEYKAKLAEARSESSRLIEDARQAADELRRDLEARADAEIAEIRQRAAADVEAAKAQALQDLKGEVASIAMGATEMLVRRNLDRNTQMGLVEDYINQVAARN
ncbi:MAG: F0F1 ATP synthase subunit B [Acidimicrobiales bacterium]